MKKIKIAMLSKNLELNGITNVILNYCNNLDLQKFSLTLYVSNPLNNKVVEEIKNRGIDIVELPQKRKSVFKYYLQLFKMLHTKKYDIIHVHGNSTIMMIELLIAKLSKIRVRIAHCHNSKCSNKIFNFLLKLPLNLLSTECLACSEAAGKWVFWKKFIVLPNAFDINKFKYNQKYRDNLRKKYDISNEIVIGHTGRFNNQKNQEFIIEFVKKLVDKNYNVKCIFVGDGPNFKNVKDSLKDSEYLRNFIFAGESSEVYKFYNMMDMFIFPSKFEGLGISILEAQLNGLNCMASLSVPKITNITGNAHYLSLDNIDEWLNFFDNNKELCLRNNIDFESDSIQFYNITKTVKMLAEIYNKYTR